MTFKELREQSGMNMTEFSRYFGINYRTIQRWEYGERKCPEYLLNLMAFKLGVEKHKADIIALYEYLSDNEATDIKLYCNAGLANYPSVVLDEILE